MNIPQPLISKYSNLLPTLQILERRVAETLSVYAKTKLVPYVSRVKTIESAAEKIETGRYSSFDEIDDLVAFTLVVPSLRDEEEAREYCNKVFKVLRTVTRTSTKKAPELFRFDATRIYANLAKPEGTDLGTRSVFDVMFEIQIRTAFEHAWIVATHPLTYKTDSIDWKRFRLSAQLKAASEQLDLAVLQFETLATGITEAPWPEIDHKINITRLTNKLIEEKVIPSEAAPKDKSRFADNLISVLRASTKKNTQVTQALALIEEGLRKYKAETFPRSVSLLQVCIGVLCEEEVLSGPLTNYSCHVTQSLIALYPAVGKLTPIFDYGET